MWWKGTRFEGSLDGAIMDNQLLRGGIKCLTLFIYMEKEQNSITFRSFYNKVHFSPVISQFNTTWIWIGHGLVLDPKLFSKNICRAPQTKEIDLFLPSVSVMIYRGSSVLLIMPGQQESQSHFCLRAKKSAFLFPNLPYTYMVCS